MVYAQAGLIAVCPIVIEGDLREKLI